MSEQNCVTKKRVFVYDGHSFEDPGAEFSNEEMRNSLASTYPALRDAEIQTTEKGDLIEVQFIKKAVTKG